MKHKDKVKLARNLSGRSSGHFLSTQWQLRKWFIERRVELKMRATQRKASAIREIRNRSLQTTNLDLKPSPLL